MTESLVIENTLAYLVNGSKKFIWQSTEEDVLLLFQGTFLSIEQGSLTEGEGSVQLTSFCN